MTTPVSFADFDFVRKLVYEHSAIALDDSKDYLVEARLAPVAQREGMRSVTELVRSLRDRRQPAARRRDRRGGDERDHLLPRRAPVRRAAATSSSRTCCAPTAAAA